MQKTESISPLFLNTDISYEEMKPFMSPFIKGLTWDLNENPNSSIGTNSPMNFGQNQLIKTPVRGNVEVPTNLPSGYNKNIGSYYSTTTQELYYFNFNGNLQHGIYVLEGNSGLWQKIVVDPNLLFTDNQENFIANHRVSLKFVMDGNKNIIEKYLLITEGGSWQKYINVIAAIRTNGFDASLFPYWTLKQPHFDRRELLEWPVRPPMIRPDINPIPNTPADLGKINRFIDKGFQVAFSFQNTDGRTTKLSPYSLPLLIKSEDFLNNPDDIPKNAVIKMYAGSPLTEKIYIYIRRAKSNSNTLTSITEWTDWYLYDVIYKFPNPNSDNILGTDYWLRINPWASYSYDSVFNTIQYIFDLSKIQQIVLDQEGVNEIQTNMPQLSVGMTDLSDAELLANNRYGYPNFGTDVMGGLSVQVVEKAPTSCPLPLRKIRLYAYIGSPFDTNQWCSQVGYYNDDTKAILFGGLSIGGSNMVDVDINVNAAFNLNFSDKNAFRCYLKGTPYFSDGTWYQVNSDNSLVKLTSLLDIREPSVKEQIQTVLVSGGYFVCVFDIDAPAGRYIATLGRHNVSTSGDYRNTSTYIYGIANSRNKSITNVPGAAGPLTSIKPNSINNQNGILYSKEMEIDCTSADVDVWGNGADLFYVYCPYLTSNHEWRFTEGYWREDVPPTNGASLPIELFPYQMNHAGANDWGKFTDKNGFYWAYTNNLNAPVTDIQIVAKINCVYPTIYNIPTSQSGSGWKQNADNYLSQFTGTGTVGAANRIIYTGRISSLDGALFYSNIGISIKDGSTIYTNSNGEFTLIVHNGMPTLRVSNVYVNAGSNFLITIASCGQIPLFNFNEALAPCIPNTIRNYPIPLILAVQISTDSQMSLMDDGKYNVGCYCADLAGRVMYVNVITEISVRSFLQRDNLNATFLRLLINAINFSNYPDMKWLMPCVSKNVNIKRQLQWVGDEINYIDNSGNIVNDPASAVFVSIKINSLYNSNLAKNFSLLANYQFVPEDRLRVLDDGDGNLFDVATYGDPIDLQILGTNYQQAAIDAGLLPPQVNTVLSTTTTTPDVTLIVKYDSRLDKLIGKTGFWIEIYTPTEQSDIIPFYEDKGFYPIVNNAIVIFTGFNNGQPVYTYPTSIDLDFWDTYLFDRNITIPNVGNKFFSHPFESQNVTDNWGANLISGGRTNIKNDNALQFWLQTETIKSDSFFNEGLINGLATFRSENKKNFKLINYGGIMAVYAESNLIFFACENNWFMTDYDFHYAFVNAQGIMQANLDGGISTPHQKIGSQFGMSAEDTGTFIQDDKELYWYDRKNTALVKCNYREAINVAEKSQEEQGGMQSFFNSKSDFITNWNNNHSKENSFDIIAGLDVELSKIYITFRCRRNNSNDVSSYANNRRNWQLNFQETIVYDITNHGWLRAEGFCPEGYGQSKGDTTGQQMISFAAGKPYLHNQNNVGFNKFYGVQTSEVIIGVFNQDNDIVKVFESESHAANPQGYFIDKIFTDFKNSFSYVSSNQYTLFYNKYYSAFFRNMNSYPSNDPTQLFRSMLADGYRNVGKYSVIRMVGNYDSLGSYKELGQISVLETMDDSNKEKGK